MIHSAWFLSAFLVFAAARAGAPAPPWHAMREFALKPQEKEVDHTPPSAPEVTLRSVWRGWGQFDGDTSAGLLLKWGYVQVTVANATDDRTPVESLGYRFEFIDGVFPDGRSAPSQAFDALPGGTLFLVWDDDATWDQDRFSFRVAVRAVDYAGNESVVSNVVIVTHDGNMDKMRAMARANHATVYSEAATRSSKWYKPAPFVPDYNIIEIDSVHVEAKAAYDFSPHSDIGEIYNAAVVSALRHDVNGRIDRFRYPDYTTRDYSKRPEPIVGPGRDLSYSESMQLRSLLLDPANYIRGKYACVFEVEFRFEFGSDYSIFVGTQCHMVSIEGPGIRGTAGLTTEAAGLLRGFCEGVLTFDRIDD